MINVLHIFSDADVGGVSAVVLNYYSHLDREKIRFDVALTSGKTGQNGEKLKELGAEVFFLPLKSEGLREYKRSLSELLGKKKYDAIHVHDNETSYVSLAVAKKHGIKIRIAHAHSAYEAKGAYLKIRRLSGRVLNSLSATHLAACGRAAGEAIYGKSFKPDGKKRFIIPNAIDTPAFALDPEKRERERERLGIGEKFAVGVVGRIAPEKNVKFAVDAVMMLHSEFPEAVLLIAGDGEGREEIEKYVREIGAESYIKLIGKVSDTPSLYSALDALVMPSLYEGFPVAALEALSSGLPVFLSDRITDELSFSPDVKYLPTDSPEVWAKALIAASSKTRGHGDPGAIARQGYDIRSAAPALEAIYLNERQTDHVKER